MCDIDCINKLAKQLNVNLGKLKHNNEKIIKATTKNGTITGSTAILYYLLSESNALSKVAQDPESQCLIRQWIDYVLLFVEPASNDRTVANVMLKEVNDHLSSRSYFVGQKISAADLFIFFVIHQVVELFDSHQKNTYKNVCRWYDHLQKVPSIRQGFPLVNLSTIHLAV